MILKYDHAVTQPPSVSQKTAGGRSAEEVNHSEFSIVKLLDAATPKLHEAACKGTHLPEVVIEVWRAGGDKPVKYMEYKLKEVLISGVISNGDPDSSAGFPDGNHQDDLRRHRMDLHQAEAGRHRCR